MVLNDDPDHFETPWVYRFGDRYFYEPEPSKDYLVDTQGRYILTKDGKKIRIKD
jgi:hypothetical protein